MYSSYKHLQFAGEKAFHGWLEGWQLMHDCILCIEGEGKAHYGELISLDCFSLSLREF